MFSQKHSPLLSPPRVRHPRAPYSGSLTGTCRSYGYLLYAGVLCPPVRSPLRATHRYWHLPLSMILRGPWCMTLLTTVNCEPVTIFVFRALFYRNLLFGVSSGHQLNICFPSLRHPFVTPLPVPRNCRLSFPSRPPLRRHPA